LEFRGWIFTLSVIHLGPSMKQRTKSVWRDQRGFTLLEILIVITILGILASLVAVKLMDRPGEARVLKAQMDIQALETALKLYKLDNAFYPTTEQGLMALVERPTTGRIPANWREGGYLEKAVLPRDPWGNDYLYLSPGVYNRDFDLWSYGADGEEGGEGEDADVTNWMD
jgi:general secretion pathway protein G